jgi:hypothetical protein
MLDSTGHIQLSANSGSSDVLIQGDLLPKQYGTYDNGNSSLYWNDGYFDTIYQHTGTVNDEHTTSFDHIDDLEVVSRYGGPEMLEPFHVLPIECTNIAKLAQEEGITVDEVYGRKDLEARVFYDPLMVGIFSLGAIKQLYAKVQELERRVA